jgi:hypothetical protein
MPQTQSCIKLFTKGGGYFGELREAVLAEEMEGWIDTHHIPSREAIEQSRLYYANGGKLDDGNPPAILMDYDDHCLTASYGNSTEAQEYRTKQFHLIEAGEFGKAQQMDIDDLHNLFGKKYDSFMAQTIEHTKNLRKMGYI